MPATHRERGGELTNRLVREASHQVLCAVCEAYAERRPYSNHNPLMAVSQEKKK